MPQGLLDVLASFLGLFLLFLSFLIGYVTKEAGSAIYVAHGIGNAGHISSYRTT